MTKKLMLTAMAVMSVATVKPFAQPGFDPGMYKAFVPSMFNNATLVNAKVGAALGLPVLPLLAVNSGFANNFVNSTKPEPTRMDKVKNALSSAKNYVVDSRLGQLVANNPKTAIAAVSATALAGIGAYVAKNFEFGSEVEAKTAPKAEVKTAPKAEVKTAPVAPKQTLTPAQKFKLRSQGIKC